jgi:V/A-type H+-transporting ATPase subunit B
VGEDELSDLDRIYLVFGNEFKTRFLSQGTYEDRSIEETLDLAWEIASILPQSELQRIEPEMLKKRYVVK